MLFNATQAEELRVAIVDGQKLVDLDIESANKEQRKSNIYKGLITRIEPSLEAAFVDYGEERHGFLPFKAVSRSYFQHGAERGRIQDALREGQEIIVQVDKDERGNKGAALTTFISLAGRYLVLMPNNPRGGGISRRVDGEDRAELREIMDSLEVPDGMSLITRTAAIGRQVEELQWDLNYLLQLWRAIEEVAAVERAPRLIYQEDSLVIRAIRDYFQPEIGEILIDTDSIFQQARDFMSFVVPDNVHRVKRYWDDVPLFSRFQIEHQIETAFGRQVNLPSGGAIVIDHTEALVTVDVNSGRATRGADIEETALKTNLEAAEEIARQLRLRDLGGLIVIDFIDMEPMKHQREVENFLKDALKFDRARVQVGKISRFGLMELSRQRIRPALAEMSYIPCPRCSGTGHIRSTESAALHILRILEEESMKEGTAAVHAQIPVEVATFLLNEKRQDIQAIELRHKVSLLLIPNVHLDTPTHSITRLKHDELNQEDRSEPSYRLIETPSEEKPSAPTGRAEGERLRQEAAIRNLSPERPAPVMKSAGKTEDAPGFFARIVSLFRGKPTVAEVKPSEKRSARGGRGSERNYRSNGGSRRGAERNERESNERAPEQRERNDRARTPRNAAPEEREARETRRPRGEREGNREMERREARAQAAQAKGVPAQSAANGAADVVAAQQAGALPPENGREGGARRGRGRRGRGGRGASGNAESQNAQRLSAEAENAVARAEETSPLPTQTAADSPLTPPPAQTNVLPSSVDAAQTIPAQEEKVMEQPQLELSVAAPEKREIPSPAATFVVEERKAVAAEETPPRAEAAESAPAELFPAAQDVKTPLASPQVLKEELEKSGLVLVQTDPEVLASAPAAADTAIPLGRSSRRARQSAAAHTETPLVLVETRAPQS
jgi:ribonuclease E